MNGCGLRRVSTLALVVASVVVAGCATGYVPDSRYADAAGANYSGRHAARQVVVENQSWNRMTVYLANSSGMEVRLGDVESMEKGVFPVPQSADDGSGMYFVAHPLAGTTFNSEQFMFPVGTTAVFRIENQYTLSNVRLR